MFSLWAPPSARPGPRVPAVPPFLADGPAASVAGSNGRFDPQFESVGHAVFKGFVIFVGLSWLEGVDMRSY